jgi:PAS domain S-box-containing protein
MLGYESSDVIGRDLHALVHHTHKDGSPYPASDCPVERTLQNGEAVHLDDEVLWRRDRTAIPVEYTSHPIRDGDEITGAVVVFHDVTGRREVEQAIQASRDQLEAILQSLADGVIVQDRGGHILYANDVAARLSGFESRDDLLATPITNVVQRFTLLDQDGAPLSPDRLPAQRVFAGEATPEAIIQFHPADGGEDRWSLTRARAVGSVNPPRLVISIFQDLTESRREQIRTSFLAEATAALSESLDYDTTLARVAELAVPILADWASVDVVEPDGRIRQVAIAHIDPEKLRWARELISRHPPDPNSATGVSAVIRSGQSQFFPEIPRSLLEAAAEDDEIQRALEELNLTSALTVPLRARGRVLGAITLVYAESLRHYSEDDLHLAEELANRAAMAVDNARLYSQAQEALQTREAFLTAVSHDLQTPLTTALGLSQLLLKQIDRVKMPERVKLSHTAEEMGRAARSMRRMVEDLLDLSRTEAGRGTPLNVEPANLTEIAGRVIEEQQRGREQHIIRLDARPESIRGQWDVSRIERMLTNLVSNAIKYSPAGGRISVLLSASPKGDNPDATVEIRVIDEGIGIPEEDLSRVFYRFYRAANVTGLYQGMGIGLSSVKQIAEQHGGSVAVESREGGGSIFSVRIPLNVPSSTEAGSVASS